MSNEFIESDFLYYNNIATRLTQEMYHLDTLDLYISNTTPLNDVLTIVQESHICLTQIAVEGVVRTVGRGIKKVFESIKKLIIGIWTKLKKFIKKIFDQNRSMRKEAISIAKEVNKSKLNKLREEYATSNEIENDTLAAKFAVKGIVDAPTVKGIINAHKQWGNKVDSLNKSLEAIVNATTDFGNVVQKGSTAEGINKQGSIAINHLLEFMIPNKKASQILQEKKTDKEIYYPSEKDTLFAGKVFRFNIETEEDTNDDNKKVRKATITFHLEKSTEANESRKLDILSKSDMSSLCKEVEELADSNDKLTKGIETAETTVGKLIDKIDRLIMDVAKDEILEENREKDTEKRIVRKEKELEERKESHEKSAKDKPTAPKAPTSKEKSGYEQGLERNKSGNFTLASYDVSLEADEPTKDNTTEASDKNATDNKDLNEIQEREATNRTKEYKSSIAYVRSLISTIGTKSGAFCGSVVGLNVKLGSATLKYVTESIDCYD